MVIIVRLLVNGELIKWCGSVAYWTEPLRPLLLDLEV